MEHLKLFATRLNVPQLIRICEELELWKELTFLYVQVMHAWRVASCKFTMCGCLCQGGGGHVWRLLQGTLAV